MRNGNNHLFVGYHVFHAHVSSGKINEGPALVTKLIADFNQLVLNDLHSKVELVKDAVEVCNLLHQLVVLCLEFVAL